MLRLFMGIEVGQGRSPSAICLAEADERRVDGREVVHFMVRMLERLPPDTRYPGLAERVAEIEAAARRKAPKVSVTIYANVTGLGKPIVDLLNAKTKASVNGVYLTHGDQRVSNSSTVTLGKAQIVARLQVLLQSERLHLPRSNPDFEVLAEELQSYEVRVEPDANERYGGFVVGSQDCLVNALGLAVQVDWAVGRVRSYYVAW